MRDPSLQAGKTVTLRADAHEIGGQHAEIVDWYDRTGPGITWQEGYAQHESRATAYAIRAAVAGLPDDDQVLMARVDGMGQLIHASEIDGYDPAPVRQSGPLLIDLRAVGQPCPACQVPLTKDDLVATILLGPGPDPAARELARAGKPFQGVFTQLHWACHTGDESYQTEA